MKQFLITFKTFHGIYVCSRYPERVIREHVKSIKANNKNEAIKKLTKHIKTIDDYGIGGWGNEKQAALKHQKEKITEALATVEFNNIN